MDNPHTANINVQFNKKDMSINRITDYSSGKKVIVPKSDWNHYASKVCYNGFAYVSLIHATIHILHFLMTTGIRESTSHNAKLYAWGKIFFLSMSMHTCIKNHHNEESTRRYPNTFLIFDLQQVLTMIIFL